MRRKKTVLEISDLDIACDDDVAANEEISTNKQIEEVVMSYSTKNSAGTIGNTNTSAVVESNHPIFEEWNIEESKTI